MIPTKAQQSALASGGVPYVGLRPFGPEDRNLFYGRDADAQFLVDKILSARITMLYAPSGVGKSSLLRARVVASLEQQDCRTLYFDSWAGVDPATDLKTALSDLVRSAGIADPLAGAPTIAELVQLRAADNRTMVLVLDQFEEFLINHAVALDPLRKELAGLVRSPSVDARVVISLREEFLAAIEPFRQEIPTLFHSTYRLEPLAPAAVRDAIINPAATFDGDVEPLLADRLVADLSEASTAAQVIAAPKSDDADVSDWRLGMRWLVDRLLRRTSPQAEVNPGTDEWEGDDTPAAEAIDLPMLQLVCEQMWRAAPAVEGRRQLTLELYRTQLGGKRKILDRHIRSCMPVRWKDQLFTAMLMKFLAPPSGLKISYSAGDLAAYTGLDQHRIERELRRLSGADTRILRQREFKESVRFELQHDALIRHIRPWRDAVLAEMAVFRRLKIAGAAAALMMAFVIGVQLYRWNEVRDNTDGRLAALARMSPAERGQRSGTTFETVASFLLFQERGNGRLDHLKRLFVERQNLLPANPIGSWTLGLGDRVGSADDPVAMRFNDALGLDDQSFNRAWTEFAHQTSIRWGVPVPTRVRLIPDPDFPRTSVQIETKSQDPVPIYLDVPEGWFLVSMAGAPESAWEFHRRFVGDWRRLSALGDTWWAVPRWSLPVWRAASLRVWSRSAYPAFAMQARYEQNPTMLLTPAAAEFLVQRVAVDYPCTAAEVVASRDLHHDLTVWMGPKHPRPLLHPHLVFDVLSDLRSGYSPEQAAASTGYLAAVNQALGAPWPQSSGRNRPCTVPKPTADLTAFEGIDAWLPPLPPKIRIAIGSELKRAWTNEPVRIEETHRPTADLAPKPAAATLTRADLAPTMHTSPETTEAFEHFRENFFRQRGIWLPTPALLKDSVDSTSGRQLRILLLDAEGQEGRSIDVPGTSRERLDRSMAVLNEEVSRATLAWVDAEQAGALAKDERIGKVLDTLNISVTDLKLLLRAVLSPRPEDAAGSAPNSASIRDSDWLLPSLVFWKAYYEDENAPKLAELLPDLAQGMRRLQAQRYATPGAAKSGDALTAIETGIGAVEAGQLDRAAALFGRALHMGGRDEIEKLFVERYAARWQADRRRRMTSACTEPTAGKLDESLRIDVEAFLQEPQAKKDVGTARNLALCLLSSMSPTVPKAKSALRLKIAGEYGVPEQWPASQAGWLATHLFEEYDPVRESEDVLDAGTRFMNAAVRRLPAKDAASLVNGLRDICLRPGPNNWCWPLLEAANEIRPDPWASLDVALALAAQESIGEVKSALPWVERARGLFSHESRTTRQQRDRFNFWSEYIPAEVSYAVGVMTGNEADFAEARRHLSGLLSAPAIKDDPSLEVRAVVLAVHVLMDGANPERDRAEEIRHAASESARTDAGSLSRTLFEGLRDGDVATVLRIVKQASDAAAHTPHTDTDSASNEKRADALFLAAIGGLLTDPEHTEWEARQFMTTGHVYAPLVSMLLMARMHGQARDDAQGLMEERWARIDPTTWDKRLRLGDRTAWYEMLLGYFAGKVPAGDIFDPLRNESTLAASRFAGLHVNRRALLTEARFYDAVRQMAKDETDGASASLKQVVDLGYKQYIEYDMAVYLQRSPIGLPVHHSDAAIPQASK